MIFHYSDADSTFLKIKANMQEMCRLGKHDQLTHRLQSTALTAVLPK
jgi:hypothetical protein